MSDLIVSNHDQIQELLTKVVSEVIKNQIPELIREATAKEYLTKQDLMQMTGWSSRTIQNLRDTNQIPFSQHRHKILYPRKGIIQFLEDHNISSR